MTVDLVGFVSKVESTVGAVVVTVELSNNYKFQFEIPKPQSPDWLVGKSVVVRSWTTD